ncbi:hypothetical protein F5B22DRAFT_611974 [Xylaria bambusicola]|uniref:uncharacterized protein n=1 Tax=Xylaria bambusicola TaxID=326684 RepID=UPI0020084178|nr:uncharacterized protein F5B22DRAFT_611974 [Xylaria bambusicola]KAI0513288.1 hypothetical protein F5B22DRAFT_611974 [Xylaria bambusicola]
MKPSEQYLRVLDVLRLLKKEPRHFHTAYHVPMKSRAPMFGLTTIGNNFWLIGDHITLARRYGEPWPSDTLGLINTWTASDGHHYAILDVPVMPPRSRPWTPDDAPTLVHLAAGGGTTIDAEDNDNEIAEITTKCVYSIGDVYIKMHHTIHCDSVDEHVTIKELSKLLPTRKFTLPTVLYHARYDNRYFLITSKVPGETAAQLWWDFDDAMKDRYADLIAEACVEVAILTSSKLGTGIDGTGLRNGRLAEALTRKNMPNILANCKTVNIDPQRPFCFFHGDMGPTNVLIDRQKGTISIIDWQAAEYVPREWIGINFSSALAMVQDLPIPENYSSTDYATRVWRALQDRGFGNDGSIWLRWKRIDWQVMSDL